MFLHKHKMHPPSNSFVDRSECDAQVVVKRTTEVADAEDLRHVVSIDSRRRFAWWLLGEFIIWNPAQHHLSENTCKGQRGHLATQEGPHSTPHKCDSMNGHALSL